MRLELIGHPWRGGGYVGIRVENPVFSVLAGQQGVRTELPPHLWEGWAAVGASCNRRRRNGCIDWRGARCGGRVGRDWKLFRALRAWGACDRGRGDRVPDHDCVVIRLWYSTPPFQPLGSSEWGHSSASSPLAIL